MFKKSLLLTSKNINLNVKNVKKNTKVVKKDVVVEIAVIGGGAAGLTAAYFASKEKAKVIIIEKMKETGKKILISGGTR